MATSMSRAREALVTAMNITQTQKKKLESMEKSTAELYKFAATMSETLRKNRIDAESQDIRPINASSAVSMSQEDMVGTLTILLRTVFGNYTEMQTRFANIQDETDELDEMINEFNLSIAGHDAEKDRSFRANGNGALNKMRAETPSGRTTPNPPPKPSTIVTTPLPPVSTTVAPKGAVSPKIKDVKSPTAAKKTTKA